MSKIERYNSRRVGINPNIQGVIGALTSFRTVDFDRMRDNGLQTAAVLYMERPNDPSLTSWMAFYKGAIRQSSSSQSLILPTPIYERVYPGNREEVRGGIPLSCTLGMPCRRLEFSILAATPEDYEGLKAFIHEAIPRLINNGYSQHNPNHLSTAWFHVGRENPYQGIVFCIDPEGLQVYYPNIPNDETSFTDTDAQRLLDLR